jgi:putative transposase
LSSAKNAAGLFKRWRQWTL